VCLLFEIQNHTSTTATTIKTLFISQPFLIQRKSLQAILLRGGLPFIHLEFKRDFMLNLLVMNLRFQRVLPVHTRYACYVRGVRVFGHLGNLVGLAGLECNRI